VSHAALDARRHVLVEKPMALDVGGIDRLAAHARAVSRDVAAMFELRAVGAVREARRLVRGGCIGSVTAVRIRTVIDKPPAYWRRGLQDRGADGCRARLERAGGGVVMMNAIHHL